MVFKIHERKTLSENEMTLILIAIIAILCVAIYMQRSQNDLIELFGFIFSIIGLVILCIYCLLAWDYIAAGYKKDIINREYKTNYTQEEIFYAHDVIDKIRELDRSRVELNGDLLKRN